VVPNGPRSGLNPVSTILGITVNGRLQVADPSGENTVTGPVVAIGGKEPFAQAFLTLGTTPFRA
jgi:hypothetical protein